MLIGSHARLSSALLALCATIACGGPDRSGELTRGELTGPDPIVVRVAMKGGKARAYRYPALDSAIWTSPQNVPALGELLGFDHENGVVAFADASGKPGWIDLRLGNVRVATNKRLSELTTADGWAIYGIVGKNEIARYTPTGDWSLTVKSREITQLLPHHDGTLLVVLVGTGNGGETVIVRMRPPDSRWLDSLAVEAPQHIVTTEVGDRFYVSSGRRLVAFATQALSSVTELRMGGEAVAIAPTPSGDRVYVVARSDAVDVIDRYSNELVARVTVPGAISDLRMDDMGRYVLARAASDETTWVISTASNRYLGAVEGAWRADLPAVARDGSIATVRGSDVVFIDPKSLQEVGRTKDGAADAWFFILWNGFRPRAQGIDQPVQFSWRSQDSLMAAALGDTGTIAFVGRRADSVTTTTPQAPRVDTAKPPAPTRTVWTVSFAVVLSEDRAQALAREISVDGQRAHVVAGRSGETAVFRVVLGPFPTRADAERIGRASGRQFWVYDGIP